MAADAYPLQWPDGWARAKHREVSRFNTRFAKARDGLMEELRLLGARHIILSTNIELRQDGLPYANQKQPADPGIAVYLEYQGKRMTFACDRWWHVECNTQAVRKTIEAIRGIERWGASDIMERAFTGFQALPDQFHGAWWAVLEVSPQATPDEVKAAYRTQRRKAHPDAGGSEDDFHRIQEAWYSYQEQAA